jgi:pentatricopeptide repeat protein
VFIQAFDYPGLDAALLLLPLSGFIDYDDARMIRTTDAIQEALQEDGLIRRYAPLATTTWQAERGFSCPCWLVECLARQGRLDEAHQVFQQASSTSNDLGLFSEAYDTKTGAMLGNFPQALTHLSLIAATVALTDMERRQTSGINPLQSQIERPVIQFAHITSGQISNLEMPLTLTRDADQAS